MSEEIPCSKCAKGVEKTTIQRCPSCYRFVCDDCRHHHSGRYFCSSQCAQFYFFEDEEET
jgi:hypothetical protein